MKKPSQLGFRPTDEEYNMVLTCIEKMKELQPYSKIGQSDVMRYALKTLYDELTVSEGENR